MAKQCNLDLQYTVVDFIMDVVFLCHFALMSSPLRVPPVPTTEFLLIDMILVTFILIMLIRDGQASQILMPIPEFLWPFPGQHLFMRVYGIYEFDDFVDVHHPICFNFSSPFRLFVFLRHISIQFVQHVRLDFQGFT